MEAVIVCNRSTEKPTRKVRTNRHQGADASYKESVGVLTVSARVTGYLEAHRSRIMGRNQWFEIWGFNVKRTANRSGRHADSSGREADRELAALLRRLSARPLGSSRQGRDERDDD